MQLRQMTFPSSGDYVLARLKASTVTMAPADVYSLLPIERYNSVCASDTKTRRKRRKRSKKKKKGAVNHNEASRKDSVSFAPTEESILSFTKDHFPSLQEEKVEWETERVDEVHNIQDDADVDDSSAEDSSMKNEEEDDGEEQRLAKALSDAASTATTTSSTNTTSSGFDLVSNKKEGYAAAVLKSNGSQSMIQEVVSLPSSPPVTAVEGGDLSNRGKSSPPAPVVSITQQPCWRSFLDVARK